MQELHTTIANLESKNQSLESKNQVLNATLLENTKLIAALKAEAEAAKTLVMEVRSKAESWQVLANEFRKEKDEFIHKFTDATISRW